MLIKCNALQACLYGRVGAVKLLLGAGADPRIPTHDGLSPMLATLSCPRGRGLQIARLLEVGRTGREGGARGVWRVGGEEVGMAL